MRSVPALLIGLLFVTAMATGARSAEPDPWPGLKAEIFQEIPILETTGVVTLEAPERAEDAALVPVAIVLAAEHAREIRKVTLVIDQNPAPVAAVLSFGPAGGLGERRIETRVRVDRYSNIRAIAEAADGRLYMAARFVKASGGCSAPASKDAELALKDLGKMLIKSQPLAGERANLADTQVMIRHPNYSGLQIDETTRGYRPARFIQTLQINLGDELLLSVEAGISIAENPHFRLIHDLDAGKSINVTARDSDGNEFAGSHRPSGS